MNNEDIVRIIEDAARQLLCEVYESSVLLQGQNSKIVVRLDKPEGVTHGDCEKYSSKLTELLDDSELLPGYSIEVSSPGLNREIKNRSEFERFIGAPVKINCIKGEGSEVLKGKLLDVREDSVVLKEETKETEIFFDDIQKTNLDY